MTAITTEQDATMNRSLVTLATLAGVALMPATAFAHSLSGSGLLAGITHPLLGLDHLLAMLAIGIWAATLSGRMRLAVPATFMALLLGGFLLGVAALPLPRVETGIALSVLLLGLLLTTAVTLPTLAVLTLTALFALCHGHAHGMETVGAATPFAVGFLTTSLALHLTGGMLIHALGARNALFARSIGGAIALSGVWLLS
jgi:urease accessory protein